MEIILSDQDRVVSTASKQIFDYAGPSVILYLGCNSLSVICLIRCSLQYVKYTGQNINKKFNWHKSCFSNLKNFFLSYIV